MNDNNKKEVILIAPKTIYTTRGGAIKMTLIGLALVGSMQFVIYDPSTYRSPGLFVAIGYVGSALFSAATAMGIYRIFKPAELAKISKEGISFMSNTLSWDQIQEIRLIKSLDRWGLKPDLIGFVLKESHPSYSDRSSTQKKAFNICKSLQKGCHLVLNTYMGSENVNKLCAELNGYLKKYSTTSQTQP